jgi:trehalose 6-phosphate phosphatase
MRTTTRRLLGQVAARYPCTVISGRARHDVRRWLQGIPVQGIIGNHGIEPWQTGQPLLDAVNRYAPLLDRRLSSLRGVRIENKAFSISVHYRQSREKKRARAAILAAAARLGPVRVIHGKQVVNILPAGAPHKGMALETERDRLGCDTAIYVGDDETDEDVFTLDQPGRLLAIRVGPKRSSQASYYVKDQAAVDELLTRLADLRREPALPRTAHS